MNNEKYIEDNVPIGILEEILGESIERPISAPAVMDNKLSEDSLFAFQSKYSHLFGDIRYEQNYESFYKSYEKKDEIPPPIKEFPFGIREFMKKEKNDSRKNKYHDRKIINPKAKKVYKDEDELLKSLTNFGFNNKKEINQNFYGNSKQYKENQRNLNKETSDKSKHQIHNYLNGHNNNTNGVENYYMENRTQKSILGKKINPKYLNVEDVEGKVYFLAKDQYGCRFLQKKLEEKNTSDFALIYKEIYPNMVELMTDPFGNYLCQKLLEYCKDKQKSNIIKAVSNDLVSIAMNMHGTRAVQKLVECLTCEDQVKMVIKSLKSSVVKLIRDLNGNHVIQRCLQKLSFTDKQFIYDAITGRCIQVATHKHGCCVLQRSIDYASPNQKNQIVSEVISNALALVKDPFGNYVVQYILDLSLDQITEGVINQFFGSIEYLSTNKFSSNVIEQCLRKAPVKIRTAMIDEILLSKKLYLILQDSYGNYVVQTALMESNTRQFQRFNDLIRPMLHLIRNTPYGKKIETKLNRIGRSRSNNYSKKNRRKYYPQNKKQF